MKAIGCSAAVLACVLNATPGLALDNMAKLQAIQGKVLLDQGQDFAGATEASQLKPGDRVFIGFKASAILAFAQCALELNKPTLYIVAKKAPCDANGKAADISQTVITPANADTIVTGSAPPDVTTGVTLGFAALVVGATANNLSLPVSKP